MTANRQKSLKSYLIGITLSLLFTVLAFLSVSLYQYPHYQQLMSRSTVIGWISVLAISQLVVQVHYFLGLNAREGKWDFMAFLFTIFVVLIVMIGSLWIMYHLNYNMMH